MSKWLGCLLVLGSLFGSSSGIFFLAPYSSLGPCQCLLWGLLVCFLCRPLVTLQAACVCSSSSQIFAMCPAQSRATVLKSSECKKPKQGPWGELEVPPSPQEFQVFLKGPQPWTLVGSSMRFCTVLALEFSYCGPSLKSCWGSYASMYDPGYIWEPLTLHRVWHIPMSRTQFFGSAACSACKHFSA